MGIPGWVQGLVCGRRLAVQVDAERVGGDDERVDAQVELVAVDEQRPGQVLLGDDVVAAQVRQRGVHLRLKGKML